MPVHVAWFPMKQIVSVLALAALVAGPVLAQQTPAAAPAAAPAPKAAVAADAVVISANGISVTRAEFEDAAAMLPAEYQGFALGPGKRQFAEEFLRMKLLATAGMKAGLDRDPAIVKQLARIRENVIAEAQLRKLQEAVTVSDADLRNAYEKRKAEFEKVQARHILIAFKGSPAAQPGKPELTEEQAKAKAEELRAAIEKGTKKFEDVAKAESDDTGSGAEGGSLGEFGHGQMVPDFEKAAFETPAGKLSPVIRTQFGYHVLRVDSHTTTSFDEAKPTLEKAARGTKLQSAADELVQEAKPSYDAAYFGAAPTAETPRP